MLQKKGMLKNFDKNYKIIDKNAGKIFKIIKKMYKTCLDDKQYARYLKINTMIFPVISIIILIVSQNTVIKKELLRK